MTCPPFIREALAQFANCVETEQGILIPTQSLYPSNGSVTLLVTGGPAGCVVSDEARAIAEIASHGFDISNPESYLRQLSACRGLN
jgi:hypothetical protein